MSTIVRYFSVNNCMMLSRVSGRKRSRRHVPLLLSCCNLKAMDYNGKNL